MAFRCYVDQRCILTGFRHFTFLLWSLYVFNTGVSFKKWLKTIQVEFVTLFQILAFFKSTFIESGKVRIPNNSIQAAGIWPTDQSKLNYIYVIFDWNQIIFIPYIQTLYILLILLILCDFSNIHSTLGTWILSGAIYALYIWE